MAYISLMDGRSGGNGDAFYTNTVFFIICSVIRSCVLFQNQSMANRPIVGQKGECVKRERKCVRKSGIKWIRG